MFRTAVGLCALLHRADAKAGRGLALFGAALSSEGPAGYCNRGPSCTVAPDGSHVLGDASCGASRSSCESAACGGVWCTNDSARTLYCGLPGRGKCASKGGDVVAASAALRRADVRCCTENSGLGWPRRCRTIPGVFGESNLPICHGEKTFDEAVGVCGSFAGGRLCSGAEMLDECTAFTGCFTNKELVWGCAANGKACAANAECCGGFCDGGFCGEYVGGTPAPTDAPTPKPTKIPTKQPTNAPSFRPVTSKPTNAATKQPTNPPTNPKPIQPPTPEPTSGPTPPSAPLLCDPMRDLIEGEEVCDNTEEACEATADLGANGRESCNAWCGRFGLNCVGAWDDGAADCEKDGSISCGETGNLRSICRCELPAPTPPTPKPTPKPTSTQDDEYHTVIVGAGAAGLAAGHTLVRQGGVDASRVKILEAQSVFGGRVKRNDAAYPEFPLDMGASFIREVPEIRGVLGDEFFDRTVKPDGVARTFKGYTYWDLFDDYVVAPIESSIEYECVVVSVSRGNQDVQTVCQDGRTFRSEFVVITVPLPILKDGDIDFDPPLPAEMTVDHPGDMWQGMKVFMEFKRDFVGNGFCMRSLGPCLDDTGENLFWDYSVVNDGLDNGNMLLAGFILGEQSEPYIDLSDEEILAQLTEELADRFNDNRIPDDLVGGVVENWSQNPYFRGTLSSWGYACPAYSNPDCRNNPPGAVDASSGAGRVFLAGEAFPTDSENGWVDAGAFSGDDAAIKILEINPGLCRRGNDSFWRRLASPDQNFSVCARRLDRDDTPSTNTPHHRMNFGAAVEL